MSGVKLLDVEEKGLPRTTRHSFQSSDVDVMQLDTSWSDFVLRVVRIDDGRFHFLKI